MLFSWFVPLFRNDFQSYANHVVTIVGYDDDFPKEYFYDPNNTIGGNGAYIVKNSWGTDWGDEGYFYISYYDQSLGEAITLDFKVNTSSEKAADTKLQSYDFSPKIYVNEIKSSDKASMANVFEADNNMYLRTVGYTSVTNNEELEYQVYLLDQDAKTPTDGTLAATVHSSCAFSGYHTADLDTPVFLKKGQRYSVVVTVKREDGKYGIALHPQINEKGLRESLDDSLKSIEESDLSDRMKEQYRKNMEESFAYFTGVVNAGESYLMAGDAWADLADISQQLHADTYGVDMDIDNFSIRAISDAEILNVTAKPETQEKQLKAGDTVKIKFTASNQTETGLDNVVLMIGENDSLAVGTVDKLGSVEKEYSYTLTEEDIQKNSAVLTVRAYLDQTDGKKELMLFDETSSTKVTIDLTSAASVTTEPAETTETTESTQPTEATETTESTQPTETTETTESTQPIETTAASVATTDTKPAETTQQTETSTETETKPAETTETTKAKGFTNEQLADYARKDYAGKNGTTPANTAVTSNADGSVSVILYDASGNVLDTYRLDPVTGKGTDQNGNAVNLPQTGVQSTGTAVTASAAVLMAVSGAFMMLRSLGRKKKED